MHKRTLKDGRKCPQSNETISATSQAMCHRAYTKIENRDALPKRRTIDEAFDFQCHWQRGWDGAKSQV